MPSYTRLHNESESSIVFQELMASRASSGPSAPSAMVERLRQIVPFDGFSFSGLDIDGCELGRGAYLSTNLPEKFTALYTEARLIEVDPMVPQISVGNPVAHWDAIDPTLLLNARTRILCQAMKAYDIAPRTSFTFWKNGRPYGAATFTRRKSFTDDELLTLDFFAATIHSALERPVIEAINARLGLHKGEILCLCLAGQGLTSEEIAADTALSVETVNTYLKTATRKLKAHNRAHAIAEAIRRKIIH